MRSDTRGARQNMTGTKHGGFNCDAIPGTPGIQTTHNSQTWVSSSGGSPANNPANPSTGTYPPGHITSPPQKVDKSGAKKSGDSDEDTMYHYAITVTLVIVGL